MHWLPLCARAMVYLQFLSDGGNLCILGSAHGQRVMRGIQSAILDNFHDAWMAHFAGDVMSFDAVKWVIESNRQQISKIRDIIQEEGQGMVDIWGVGRWYIPA